MSKVFVHMGISLGGFVAGVNRALHTLGADAVFVALHPAARGSRVDGRVRWDNAAACVRGPCRPDGYGVCRLGGRDTGLFLESARGTERARAADRRGDALALRQAATDAGSRP